MHKTRQIFSVVFIVLGVALIVRGFWGGAWPLSIQSIAGALLIVLGVLRLRYS
jgi:drug/metabolite transporter (DMT)-like permease